MKVALPSGQATFRTMESKLPCDGATGKEMVFELLYMRDGWCSGHNEKSPCLYGARSLVLCGRCVVLREFVDAANRWGIKICYYLNVQDDGYMVSVAKMNASEFIRNQVGMVREVLTHYGPVHRFWFDGTSTVPKGTDVNKLWETVYDTIRKESPSTMISAYRGDICASTKTLYVRRCGAGDSRSFV